MLLVYRYVLYSTVRAGKNLSYICSGHLNASLVPRPMCAATTKVGLVTIEHSAQPYDAISQDGDNLHHITTIEGDLISPLSELKIKGKAV